MKKCTNPFPMYTTCMPLAQRSQLLLVPSSPRIISEIWKKYNRFQKTIYHFTHTAIMYLSDGLLTKSMPTKKNTVFAWKSQHGFDWFLCYSAHRRVFFPHLPIHSNLPLEYIRAHSSNALRVLISTEHIMWFAAIAKSSLCITANMRFWNPIHAATIYPTPPEQIQAYMSVKCSN